MCCQALGQLPNSFHDVQIGRIRRQIHQFQAVLVAQEVISYGDRMMIPCIIKNQIDFSSRIPPKDLTEIRNEGSCIKSLNQTKVPSGILLQADCAIRFDRSPTWLAIHRRPCSPWCPCPEDGSGLLKHGLVFMIDYGSFFICFFFTSEYVS